MCVSNTKVFVKPLQQLVRDGTVNDPKLMELNSIISKVEYIINLNATLRDDLSARANNWSDRQRIGDIFVKMVHPQSFSLLSKILSHLQYHRVHL